MLNNRTTICFLNDRFLPYDEASLHVSDLALHRGYGVFDFFREIKGRVPFLDDYLDRFHHSAAGLGLAVPVDRPHFKEIIHHLLKENKFENSGIKIILTGGYTDDFYRPLKPNLVVINVPFHGAAKSFEKGVRLMLFEHIRFLPEIKTIGYLPAVWLLPRLLQSGAIEPLYHFDGKILETSRGNFFLVKNNAISTPKDDILFGIIRKHLITLSAKKHEISERDILLEEIRSADEIFITGTSKHVLPVVQIDDIRIGDGKPGPVTLELRKEFEDYIDAGN